MLEVEVLGHGRRPQLPPRAEVRRLSRLAAQAADVDDGHVAIQFVGAERIAQLNAEHRGKAAPTDVLSFPVDGAAPVGEPGLRELGDVVVCPEQARDVREAIVHGVLHLVGFDHEADDGEMLALQRRLLRAP
jgi:probable rRNA maturation factor